MKLLDMKCILRVEDEKVYFEVQNGLILGLDSVLFSRGKRMLVWKVLENLKLLRFRRRAQNFRRKSAI